MESAVVSASASRLRLGNGIDECTTNHVATTDHLYDASISSTRHLDGHGPVLYSNFEAAEHHSQGFPGPFYDTTSVQDMSTKASSRSHSSSSTSPTIAIATPAPSTSASSRKRTSPPDSVAEDSRNIKRQRNTEAARRYRQKKVDRVTELEEALAEITRERDELRLRLAKADGEVSVLRGMVAK